MSSNVIEDVVEGQAHDTGIFWNSIYCIGTAAALFVTFCLVRTFFVEVYAPNLLSKKRKLHFDIRNGNVSWIRTALQMPDSEFLPWAGLDAFIFVQTLKLILVIMATQAIPAFLLLMPVYAMGKTHPKQLFLRLSIMNVENSNVLWLPLAFNYITAGIVLYAIYTFYRNLVVYRQAYLKCPSVFVSLVTMRRIAQNVGSLESARRLLNLTSRSNVVTNVSAKYSKSELIAMFEQMGLADISAIVIVQNRRKVRKLLERRNITLMQLELAFLRLYEALLAHMAQVYGRSSKELEREYLSQPRLSLLARKEMMRMLLDESLFPEFRPKHKNQNKVIVDAIFSLYQELILHDDELAVAANRFASDNERYILERRRLESQTLVQEQEQTRMQVQISQSQGEAHSDARSETDSLAIETDLLIHTKSLVSWHQFTNIAHNLKDYHLTLWGTSMSVVVIFGSQRSASIGSQCLLSSRPFSMDVFSAPTADDIIWDNLYLPEADRFVRRLFGDLLYALVNLLFMTIISLISPMLSLKEFEAILPALHHLLDISPKVRILLSSILVPMIYNIFLLLAPFLILALCIYQGNVSKTMVQDNVMKKYTWLLFAQSFIVLILMNTFIEVFQKIKDGRQNEILEKIQLSLPNQSAFFFNVVLQRALISLMLILVKPAPLMFWVFSRLFGSSSPRACEQNSEPQKLAMGVYYPEYVLLIFIIVMAFVSLTPIILLAGLLFFAIAYFVFRYHFIYSYEVPHESGGKHWMFVPRGLLVGLLNGQIFTMIHFTFRNGTAQALVLVPLVLVIFSSIFFIESMFDRRAKLSPLGPEGDERISKLIDHMEGEQQSLIRAVGEQIGEDYESAALDQSPLQENATTTSPMLAKERNFETIPYDFAEQQSRLVFRDACEFQEMSALDNPYCNPIVFKRLPYILLPSGFFHLIQDALAHHRQPQADGKK